MIGLREDQQVKVQLVARINQLFPVAVNGAVVASGLAIPSPFATTAPLTAGLCDRGLDRWLSLEHRRPLADFGVPGGQLGVI